MQFTPRNLTVLLLALFCSQSLPAQSFQSERPNIIFILTDDQRFDALGYAGNELIHTPEMDKLAETGAFFSKAMVTTPICAARPGTVKVNGKYWPRNGRAETPQKTASLGSGTYIVSYELE